MFINRVEVKDYLIFKDELRIDFCPGVNILIGGNATGKTTLLKRINKKEASLHSVYIPEKDILEHAKGLLTFIEQKQTGFDPVYRDVLIAAQDTPTLRQTPVQQSVGGKIEKIIGGAVYRDENTGAYYTLKSDGRRIPFDNEASGYKKLGFLSILVTSGQLEAGSVLLWDEPENSLNPEIMPEFVEILLELAQSGVQIFLATHHYYLARYFDVRKDKTVPVLFHSLTKEEGRIVCDSSPEYMKLGNNLFESSSSDLFKAVVADALGDRKDE